MKQVEERKCNILIIFFMPITEQYMVQKTNHHLWKTQWSIEIASYVHEEFTETVTTTTTIIIDDLEIDFKIHSNNGAREIKICDVDVAMLFERLLPQPTIDNNTPFFFECLREKITMYERRKQFRIENRMWSYSKIRFYRELSKHEVIRDEIVSFWSTMWNNNETVSINDFLLDFVLENHPTMFPSLDEFVNFINLLPN
ncbi:hypothetical protein CWI39_0532p0010 [Hamiltosporidium magnivora]|uniref:Uncharacterized protein n=2 Tax=Hamiltosporidium magnivora TaxID=148818 RepID=A0A4Q9LE49_9MICR|nr:hypothetical protein CWI39_0532p0010 [Hamiltosporidium magnivora]